MKQTLLIILLATSLCFAQKPSEIILTLNKVTAVQIEGTKVKNVILGNGSIISQYKNPILTLQAKETFNQISNMIMVCEDTVLYFNVKFELQPKKDPLFYKVVIESKQEVEEIKKTNLIPKKAVILKPDFDALKKLQSINITEERANEIEFELTNLNIDKNFMYYSLKVQNNSPVEYSVGHFTIALTSKKKSSLPNQSNEIELIASTENVSVVNAKSTKYFYFATPIYALRKEENLQISIFEKSRISMGRNLKLNVSAKQFNNKIRNIKTKIIYYEEDAPITNR